MKIRIMIVCWLVFLPLVAFGTPIKRVVVQNDYQHKLRTRSNVRIKQIQVIDRPFLGNVMKFKPEVDNDEKTNVYEINEGNNMVLTSEILIED